MGSPGEPFAEAFVRITVEWILYPVSTGTSGGVL